MAVATCSFAQVVSRVEEPEVSVSSSIANAEGEIEDQVHDPNASDEDRELEDDKRFVKVALLQQATPAPLQPSPTFVPPAPPPPPAAQQLTNNVFQQPSIERSLLAQSRRKRLTSRWDVVFGTEARFRSATDAGSLIGKSINARGVASQRRGPIVTDTQVRGSRVGPLLAAGSYWFPARPDLDTLLSKMDSRAVEDVLIIKGPYAARYGPAFDFVDVQLLGSPRNPDGYSSSGSTSVEHRTNGEQWYGRQSWWGGAEDWGFRFGYGYGAGVDYEDGSGRSFMSSYKSGTLDFALGYDFTPDRHLEFTYLRQDQNDVEFASQMFDIGFLDTDGYELTLLIEDHPFFDLLAVEGWHNQTRLDGDLNSPEKQAQVPYLAGTGFRAVTDTANSSSGFSAFGDWVGNDDAINTIGVDFRYLTQEINQFGSSSFFPPANLLGNNSTTEINFPLPESYSANPGLFFERTKTVSQRLTLNAGGRFDLVETNASRLVEEANGLVGLSNQVFYNPDGNPITVFDPGSGTFVTVPGVAADLEDFFGSSLNQSFALGSGYLAGDFKLNESWTLNAAGAFAMRAPTMIELYAAAMAATVLPQTVSSVLIGEPSLKSEKRLQLDLGLQYDNGGHWRGGVNGFHAWVHDFITYDLVQPANFLFKYTNTDLATLAGFDAFAELETTKWLSAFALVSYVEGRDHSRREKRYRGARFRTPKCRST